MLDTEQRPCGWGLFNGGLDNVFGNLDGIAGRIQIVFSVQLPADQMIAEISDVLLATRLDGTVGVRGT